MTLTRLADIIHLNTDRVSDPASAGIDRFVGLEHIEPENLHIRRWGLVADGTTFTNTFKRGQVLFGKRRAYQRKVAVADFDGVCSSDIYVFESKDPNVLLPELVPFILQSEGFYQYAVKTSAGSLSPRTNWTHLANYEFPLPPVDEQRRIADLLWAADDAIEAISALIHSGNNLINSMREEYFNNGMNKSSAKPEHVKLSQCCEITSSKRIYAKEYTQSGIPFYRGKEIIEKHKGLSDVSTELFISEEKFEELSRKFGAPQSGDLLLTAVGTLGVPYVVSTDDKFYFKDGNLIWFKNFNGLLPQYLYHYLLSSAGKRQLAKSTIGSSQSALTIVRLEKITIPLPNINIQQDFVERLEQTASSLSLVEMHRRNSLAVKKQILTSSLG